MKNSKRPEQIDFLRYMGKWFLLASGVAALAGSASALLLFALIGPQQRALPTAGSSGYYLLPVSWSDGFTCVATSMSKQATTC